MKSIGMTTEMAIASLLAGLALAPWPAPGQPAAAAAKVPASDIEVTIRDAAGHAEIFSKEVAAMEIIVGPDSRILYVHLILMTENEKDTHCWYNYANLTNLRYRFLAITGKGKVAIRKLSSFDELPKQGIQPKIPQLAPDDFK